MRASAILLSRLFDPIVVGPLSVLLVIVMAMINGYDWWILMMVMIVNVIVPVFYIGYRYLSKGGDWDIRDRKERQPLYIAYASGQLVVLILVYMWGATKLAGWLGFILVTLTVFGMINSRYKISIHAGVNMLLVMLMWLFFGYSYWWLIIIPLLVSWSRVYLGFHTWGQVGLGMIVPLMCAVGLQLLF
jgi:membrane-associated phospholipid phosphatase